MKQSYIFLAPGFEEIEAIAPIDILRRAGMAVTTVSITPDSRIVAGANNIPVEADITIDEIPDGEARWLILPGGMPGAENLYKCERLAHMLRSTMGGIAAICAAPAVVLGQHGLLKGHNATCYPGFENLCKDAVTTGRHVEVSGNIITAQGPGWAIQFALTIVAQTLGDKAAQDIAAGLLTTYGI